MFWVACGDSMIVNYNKAVQEVMNGCFLVFSFKIGDKNREMITLY
jgi:hypothetical protein